MALNRRHFAQLAPHWDDCPLTYTRVYPMKTSLDHLPEYKQQELQQISSILRETLAAYVLRKTASRRDFKIHKIILFGSHAKGGWVSDVPNGYVSDYDILVIVNKPSLVEEDVLWQAAKEQIEHQVKSAPLGLIVHTLNDVNDQLNKGHYFFKDIREQGIALYEASQKALAVPGNLTEEEQHAIAQAHYDHWFVSAADFYELFEISVKKKKLAQSAFLLHQATERFFSCALLTLTNYLPKTHDIEKLKKYCAEQNTAFANLFPLDDKFHRRSFRRLQRAYVDARYSMHYDITEEELIYLAQEVETLKILVQKVCLARLRQ